MSTFTTVIVGLLAGAVWQLGDKRAKFFAVLVVIAYLVGYHFFVSGQP